MPWLQLSSLVHSEYNGEKIKNTNADLTLGLRFYFIGTPIKTNVVAKLAFNFNFNCNLVGSWDNLIPNCSSHPPPATRPTAKVYLDVCLASTSTSINPNLKLNPNHNLNLNPKLNLNPNLNLNFN